MIPTLRHSGWKRQDCGDGEMISGRQGLGERGEQGTGNENSRSDTTVMIRVMLFAQICRMTDS